MDQKIINQLEGLISNLKNSQSKETIVDMETLRKIFMKGYNSGSEDVFRELRDSSLEVSECTNFNQDGFDVELSFEKEIDIDENFIIGIKSNIQSNSYPVDSLDAIINNIIAENNKVLIEDSTEKVQEESERKHQVTEEQIDAICKKMMAEFDTDHINTNSNQLRELDGMVETLVHIFEEIMGGIGKDCELAMDCLISVDEEYFDGKFTFGVSKKYDYES